MSANFVPLAPARSASKESGDFRVRVVPGASPVSPFIPIQPKLAHTHAGAVPAEPTVTLQKDGDRVTGEEAPLTGLQHRIRGRRGRTQRRAVRPHRRIGPRDPEDHRRPRGRLA